MIKISIITPSFNCSRYIRKTIESVVGQTEPDWEMIIIDDASTDNSIQVIKDAIKDEPRIKLIELSENLGTAQARNMGLEYSSGRYIAFLDSDDIWYKDKLQLQIKFMSLNSYPISFTSYRLIDEHGNDKNHCIHVVESLNKERYLKNTIIGLSTSIIDTKFVRNNFKFLDIRTRQDTSLWITLLGEGHLAYGLDIVLAQYRVHSKSISSNRIKAAKQVWNLYYNIHKLGFLSSIYYFTYYSLNAIKKRL